MQHYHLSDDMAFLNVQLTSGTVRQVLLTGQPGTGKTAFSQHVAEQSGAEYLYLLCHSWLSNEDLFNVLDVAALAVGIEDVEDAWTHGILRQAADASHEGKVVLCLDEIDKTSPKVEALLLDFLQTGRVPLPDHRLTQAKQENLVVILTSNGQRQLSDALLRRLFRMEVPFLPAHVEHDLLRKRTGAPVPLIKAVHRLVDLLRKSKDAGSPSLSEAEVCVRLLCAATSQRHAELAVSGTLARSEEDVTVLKKIGNWPSMIYGIVRQECGNALVYSA